MSNGNGGSSAQLAVTPEVEAAKRRLESPQRLDRRSNACWPFLAANCRMEEAHEMALVEEIEHALRWHMPADTWSARVHCKAGLERFKLRDMADGPRTRLIRKADKMFPGNELVAAAKLVYGPPSGAV